MDFAGTGLGAGLAVEVLEVDSPLDFDPESEGLEEESELAELGESELEVEEGEDEPEEDVDFSRLSLR